MSDDVLLSSFTITRVLDCIADPTKNRVIARFPADNPEARSLEEEFQTLYQRLLARQQAGEELPREEVDRFYRLRNQVESHPLIVERDLALSELKGYFADVAFQLSALLGADYTALARRA